MVLRKTPAHIVDRNVIGYYVSLTCFRYLCAVSDDAQTQLVSGDKTGVVLRCDNPDVRCSL